MAGRAERHEMLQEDLEELLVQDADAQPARLAGVDVDGPVLGAAPVAVEGREGEGGPGLLVVHARGEVGIHARGWRRRRPHGPARPPRRGARRR